MSQWLERMGKKERERELADLNPLDGQLVLGAVLGPLLGPSLKLKPTRLHSALTSLLNAS